MINDIRRIILAYLASGKDKRFGEEYLVGSVRKESGASNSEVWEALWSLVGDGLIYLQTQGQHSGTDNWGWSLSEIGKSAADDCSWEPRDPDGFMNQLRREIPHLDPDIELYFRQALGSFSARCFLASSVMLGVAAERAFQLMAESYANSGLPGADKFAKVLADRNKHHYCKWTEFRKRIDSLRHSFPEGLGDILTFDSLADLIRVARNEAGHPSGRQIDEDTARIHLRLAPILLRKMDLLSEYFLEQASASSI